MPLQMVLENDEDAITWEIQENVRQIRNFRMPEDRNPLWIVVTIFPNISTRVLRAFLDHLIMFLSMNPQNLDLLAPMHIINFKIH